MRRNAENWLELADKVWALRRDVIPAGEAAVLQRKRDELRQSVRARADAAKLKLQIEELEGALRQSGGAVYPKSALVENVEFFLVAAIVILGIRTYFLQPFKIPTNSMWPTYYGMTAETFPLNAPAPSGLQRLFRLAAFGAVRHTAIAPRSGEVSAQFYNRDYLAYSMKKGRSWLVFPTDLKEYTFYVDGEPVTVDVPADFGSGSGEHAGSFDDIVIKSFFGSKAAFDAYWDKLPKTPFPTVNLPDNAYPGAQVSIVPLGKTVEQGRPVLQFDILTGDQLFVDRFTYHFFPPQVGQGFVFRTDNIEGIAKEDYYIKRLVGTPGDRMEIHPPVLYRNGQPITGAKAFSDNANRVAPYTGYTTAPDAYQPPGWTSGSSRPSFFRGEGPLVIPDDGYFAMGDNSSNSLDGRYWGLVPRDSVIGRPLFIYYPFTRRWGPAH